MQNIITEVILIICAVLAIKKIIKNKKTEKKISCGCDCSVCQNKCH